MMKDKKQFFIPKNYDKKFSFIPGISGWQQFIFVPAVGLDYLVLKYTSFGMDDKILFIAFTLGLPWMLLGHHPVRENVPLLKHFMWRIQFMNRQRKFQYRKEGYHVEVISKETAERASESEGIKEAAASKKIGTRLDSCKVDRKRVLDHPTKQNNHVLESIGNKS